MEVQQQPPQQPGAPSVIRIKRKRDDAPIDSLFLENNKRRATDHTYVFKRLEVERRVEPIFRQEYDEDGIPKIRATAAGEEKRDPYALGRVKDVQSPTRQKETDAVAAGPRRFHLSRAMSASDAAKGKSDVATFVERKHVLQKGAGTADYASSQQDGASQERTFKRPTARSRMGQGSGTATPTSSAQVDASMAQKMDQWSQETSQQEQEGAATNRAAASQTTISSGDAMEIDNEADYVYDTYYRQAVAAGEMPDKGISFGHLIIDEDQEDLWETYLDGNESDDKEFDTDDEDSNAEDYYGADYPEDEVASDDEYDRDIYQFRKNADDLEEFDIHERETYEIDDELVRSDDEGDDGDEKLMEARAWKRDFGKTVRGDDMVL